MDYDEYMASLKERGFSEKKIGRIEKLLAEEGLNVIMIDLNDILDCKFERKSTDYFNWEDYVPDRFKEKWGSFPDASKFKIYNGAYRGKMNEEGNWLMETEHAIFSGPDGLKLEGAI